MIKNSIKKGNEKLVLGRTANEYKSNFGAQPIRSHIYLKVENRFLRTILKPVYSRVRVKRWRQRRPFKIKDG